MCVGLCVFDWLGGFCVIFRYIRVPFCSMFLGLVAHRPFRLSFPLPCSTILASL